MPDPLTKSRKQSMGSRLSIDLRYVHPPHISVASPVYYRIQQFRRFQSGLLCRCVQVI